MTQYDDDIEVYDYADEVPNAETWAAILESEQIIADWEKRWGLTDYEEQKGLLTTSAPIRPEKLRSLKSFLRTGIICRVPASMTFTF